MTEDGKVELVARAIAGKFFDDESAWAGCVDEAVAAIEAIAALEPSSDTVTEGMIEAGFRVLWGTELSALGDNPQNYKNVATAIYTAMRGARGR